MWLFNIDTLELKYFTDVESCPPYAALSHRWDDDNENEVTFNDLQSHSETVKAKPGYTKLVNASSVARKLLCDWIWVDTCCINKQSSAELQEAINSMWKIYEKCQLCIAYLFDVGIWHDARARSLDSDDEEHSGRLRLATDTNSLDIPYGFSVSEWFSRGWTLQELLAPKEVLFFDGTWFKVGTKRDLRCTIESITGIPAPCLEAGMDYNKRKSYCVATKMSWAASRETTRTEDEAYSLMGLFDVHIPLFYGEGRSAFRRLQEEILRTTSDATVLAFFSLSPRPSVHMLASSPDLFQMFRGVSELMASVDQQWNLTNVGLAWTAYPTGFSMIPHSGSTDHVWLSIRIGCQKLSIDTVKKLSRHGLPIYVPHRKHGFHSTNKLGMKKTNLVDDFDKIKLDFYSIYLILNLSEVNKETSIPEYHNSGLSLLALSGSNVSKMLAQKPKEIIVRDVRYQDGDANDTTKYLDFSKRPDVSKLSKKELARFFGIGLVVGICPFLIPFLLPGLCTPWDADTSGSHGISKSYKEPCTSPESDLSADST